jgi:putative two-component system response regulator
MNILLVDDNAANLLVYKGILRNIPGAVAICHLSSAEALAWSEHNDSELVVVDYNMPAPNGIEFIKLFRRIPGKSDVPILMITAETDKSLRYRALETGASDFLTKPVDVIEFTARAKNMLELRKSRKALEGRAGWLAAEVQRATAQIIARERETIWRLARAAEYRDIYTGKHIVRMAQYCRLIAKAAGHSAEAQDLILMSSPMHDVGKIAIPDSILLKPGKLDDAEFEIMKQHTVIGYEILKDSTSQLLNTAADIAVSHHERYDGSGYPYGLGGDQIPIVGQICSVSDVFDALTSVRPYKRAWHVTAAIGEVVAGSGTQFNPQLITAFERALPDILKLKSTYADEALTAYPERDHAIG